MTLDRHDTPRVSRIKLERRNDALIADNPRPRVSWIIETGTPNWTQLKAEIRLSGSRVAEVLGRESTFVPWMFEDLDGDSRHTIEVRVAGADGVLGPWSEPHDIRTGFLADGQWKAEFIGADKPTAAASPVRLRQRFEVRPDLVGAFLYASAQGVYQATINGTDVDDAVMKPGWTAYERRLLHESTDITALIRPGLNTVGVRLAGGWWTEEYGFGGDAARVYGDQPSVGVQIHLAYADGSRQIVLSGPDWHATAAGPLVDSSIYRGETIDLRQEEPGWDSVALELDPWPHARVVDGVPTPMPQISEPVRRTEVITPVAITQTAPGEVLLDFGQNLVGRLRLEVNGPAGHTIVLRHAEVLNDGALATAPLRAALAIDRVTLSGEARIVEPEFTFHGFRYAQISNWPGEFPADAVTAIVLGSDMRRTGWFESSDPLLNRLHENVVWGMRGNFLALPTDCPQRDERMGWTGDIQAFSPTATYLYDCGAFLASWLRDVAIEQDRYDGVCPVIVPNVLEWGAAPVAAWGDAAVIVPTVLHARLGDRHTLETQYPWMCAWVDAIAGVVGDDGLWRDGFQYGDWLDPDAPAESPMNAKTTPDVVASAYQCRSLRLVAEAAAELGRDDDHARYLRRSQQAVAAWQKRYLIAPDRLSSDTPTAYCLAVGFDLVPEQSQQAMGDRLAALVVANGYRIGTGFVGTSLLPDVLVRAGHRDVAERLLMQTEMPSWLYPVTMGATTIWERWDSMLPDGSVNPGEMTSFNHYTFGSIADWMHRAIAGLSPAAPGYREILIAPPPRADLHWASTAHDTPYGRASVRWRCEASGTVAVDAEVPPNTTATVDLPGQRPFTVGSGSHRWLVPAQTGEEG